ncbi:MAG: DUF1236 domain-containing protein [Bradyrhizobium sp.]|uniref:DUF1236 domain-containing protein n=1 Tax=Bradyrhizobium sp. TaxID=376 RepID=UPI003D0DA264
MSNRFLISVAAAALIAGTGLANAQGAGGGMSREGGAGAAVQHNAPPAAGGAAQSAPQHREPSPTSSGMKSSQSEKAPAATRQAEDMKAGKDMKSGKEMKAESREGKEGKMPGHTPDKSGTTAQSREDRMKAESKGSADSKSQTTTGQAAAGAKMSTEQRTKISTVIKSQRVAPVTNVNFSISIGTRVPRTVVFHTLPTEVVTIYPQWRGYKFILVKEEIVIVDPNTYAIVAVIAV